MSTPTPDEITEALATLHRLPYARNHTTLGEIKAANTPLWWVALDVLRQLDSDSLPEPGELAAMISASAAAHGLRITTDPEPASAGELVGYQHLDVAMDGWRHVDAATWYGPTTNGHRNVMADAASENYRAVAVYLLPEGGQS